MLKLLKSLRLALSLKMQTNKLPMVSFDAEEKTTYTKEEVDALKQEIAKNSFNAGKNSVGITDEQKQEYEALRQAEQARKDADALNNIATNLKGDELKDTGLASPTLFAGAYQARLKDKNGAELVKEVNAIRAEIIKSQDEEKLKAYFGAGLSEVDANGALKRAVNNNDKPGTNKSLDNMYYPGSTIRKR